jgi:undecaprenyl-diphosphatase
LVLVLPRRQNPGRTQRLKIPPSLLVCLLLVALALAGLEFAWGEHELDRALLFGLPDPLNGSQVGGPSWLVGLAWNVTALGSPDVTLPVALVVGAGFVLARQTWEGVFILITVTGGAGMGYLLKAATNHFRPHHAVDEFSHAIMNTSFPSGHAMMATLLGLSVALAIARTFPQNWALRAYVFLVALLFAGLVGVSRCYLGFHWPSDILAGWSVAAIWAYFCYLALCKLAPEQSAAAPALSKPFAIATQPLRSRIAGQGDMP